MSKEEMEFGNNIVALVFYKFIIVVFPIMVVLSPFMLVTYLHFGGYANDQVLGFIPYEEVIIPNEEVINEECVCQTEVAPIVRTL